MFDEVLWINKRFCLVVSLFFLLFADMPVFLWYLKQMLEPFRWAEVEAVSALYNTPVTVTEWDVNTPFLFADFQTLEVERERGR